MSSLDNEKSDSLMLTTIDNKQINYSIKKFSKISKLFVKQINCTSFDKFSNKKEDGSIDYKLFTDSKIINWILDIYYVDDYFDNKNELLNYRKYEIENLDKLLLLDIYFYCHSMEIIQIQYDIEKYLCNEIVNYFVPNMIENESI